ncbi:MAG: nucleotide exchange factor GrpE [Phytoplasma sp.]|uniref:nucleotide exchange factor GrpE n=1 Tax=Phytoplasma sp. TaxID=2155 RepID=UPI002B40A9D7|nr:nucleotide exchange factor GrpE [Phytoplasma sp.]WRH06870.1 MAG: nucleotide exchange factor GrpE [Phytoplasma sp.]
MKEKEIQKENCCCEEIKCCCEEIQKDQHDNDDVQNNKTKSCNNQCNECSLNETKKNKKQDNNKKENHSNSDETKNQYQIKNNELEKEIKQLKDNLSEINKMYKNEKLKYQANLDNFQKRIQKEKIHSLKYASMNLITQILVPLEQLEKVLEMSPEEPLLKNFLSGFKMIHQQIKEILNKDGVKEIKALGEKFNPEFHHAIEKISDKNKPDGVNVAVLQKGFIYKDLVIKPVMVKVNEWSKEKNENK